MIRKLPFFIAVFLCFFQKNTLLGEAADVLRQGSVPPQFNWVKIGKIKIGKELFGTNYIYVTTNGQYIVLNGSLENCARVVELESVEPNSINRFLTRSAVAFFYSVFAPERSSIISDSYINTRKSIPQEGWDKSYTPDALDKANEALSEYSQSARVSVTEKSWSLDFALLMSDGSVESWNVSGELGPFTILSLSRKVLASRNTILMPKNA